MKITKEDSIILLYNTARRSSFKLVSEMYINSSSAYSDPSIMIGDILADFNQTLMTASSPLVILVATCTNKMLPPQVSIEEGKTLASRLGCKFLEASIPPVFEANNTGLRNEFGDSVVDVRTA